MIFFLTNLVPFSTKTDWANLGKFFFSSVNLTNFLIFEKKSNFCCQKIGKNIYYYATYYINVIMCQTTVYIPYIVYIGMDEITQFTSRV
jgi:hypothetical protein